MVTISTWNKCLDIWGRRIDGETIMGSCPFCLAVYDRCKDGCPLYLTISGCLDTPYSAWSANQTPKNAEVFFEYLVSILPENYPTLE